MSNNFNLSQLADKANSTGNLNSATIGVTTPAAGSFTTLGASGNATIPTVISNTVFNTTGAITLPVGTTAQQPASPTVGQIRYNSQLNQVEGYNGTAWTQIGGGATGGGTDQVFVQNSTTVTTTYTFPSGKNASSVGPISINSGVTVTVPSGQRWVVL